MIMIEYDQTVYAIVAMSMGTVWYGMVRGDICMDLGGLNVAGVYIVIVCYNETD